MKRKEGKEPSSLLISLFTTAAFIIGALAGTAVGLSRVNQGRSSLSLFPLIAGGAVSLLILALIWVKERKKWNRKESFHEEKENEQPE